MEGFVMHIGHPGYIDIDYTVKRKRSVSELLDSLPAEAPERLFLQNDASFREAFPSGEFHCWGIPPRAEPAFRRTAIGDLILIAPWIGVHSGGIHQLGVVKAKCPVKASQASPILWPKTPDDRLYPWLLFFDTEVGYREWYEFLSDLQFDERWNPRGWYRRIDGWRFRKWGGPDGYLKFLRGECGFRPL